MTQQLTQPLVLNSLSDLAQVRDRFAVDDGVPEHRALVPVIDLSDPEAMEKLTADAADAIAELQSLLTADRTRRDQAEQGLARWRHAAGQAAHATRIAGEMREAAKRAATLATAAMVPDDRATAEAMAATTSRLANQAEAHATVLQREADALAQREDIKRLLAEERDQEQVMEMRDKLALAKEHLDAGEYEEARPLLTLVEKNISVAPDLRELLETLQNRCASVKAQAAESVLREARRLHRREPVVALDLLEPLDLAGLPEELARHLYGLWLTICRRFRLTAAVHYRAGHGRGAVLVPHADGYLRVVAAIGLRRWERDQVIPAHVLRGARALS